MVNRFIKNGLVFLVIIVVFFILLSFVIGLFVRNWPILILDKEIKITDVLTYGTTFLLAIAIPFYVESIIARSKKIENIVVKEIESYRIYLDNLQNRYLSFYQNGSITDNNKAELFTSTVVLDTKYTSLDKLINKTHKQESLIILGDFKTKHILFWRILTSDNLMSQNVNTISEVDFQNELSAFQELDESLINMIIEIA